MSTEQHCISGLFLKQNNGKRSHTEVVKVVFKCSNRKAQTAAFRVHKHPLCQGLYASVWECRCKPNALSPWWRNEETPYALFFIFSNYTISNDTSHFLLSLNCKNSRVYRDKEMLTICRVVRMLCQKNYNSACITCKFCAPFSWFLCKFYALFSTYLLDTTLFAAVVYLLSFT